MSLRTGYYGIFMERRPITTPGWAKMSEVEKWFDRASWHEKSLLMVTFLCCLSVTALPYGLHNSQRWSYGRLPEEHWRSLADPPIQDCTAQWLSSENWKWLFSYCSTLLKEFLEKKKRNNDFTDYMFSNLSDRLMLLDTRLQNTINSFLFICIFQ